MEPGTGLLADDAQRQRVRLTIAGAVQGVGFRPFAYRLAVSEGLGGFVRNTGSGVALEVEGEGEAVERFLARLEREVRPPAVIDRIAPETIALTGQRDFSIAPSSTGEAPGVVVQPDLAMCEDCRAEMNDPANRRYRYPFTSCMHCGPRFSIIEAVPYDRARTAMRHFAMCNACRAEYHDPASRRFHAEINACPDCGPRLTLRSADGATLAEQGAALEQAAQALRDGQILALKGLGGFQLLVDARNEAAVTRLRQRKHRPAKPFAVMAGSIAQAHALAYVSRAERQWLESPVAPIVLLHSRTDASPSLAPNVASANPNIGLMLPYTPLHHLLMDMLGFPVVATSGNRSGEPLAANDEEALSRLSGIADLFLTHDRPILHPVDDSVLRVIAGKATVLRSARGFAPLVLTDPHQTAPVLALGGHMKSSVAVGQAETIVLGPHVGDLDSVETRAAFSSSIASMTALYGLEPARVACDAHPGYHSTHVAQAMGRDVCKAPHHLAHVLSAMIDNDLSGPVLGVAWDGTGHGSDGTIWGGEFLALGEDTYRRAAHLLPFRLPGGDAAIREPRRAALGALHALYGDALWDMECEPLAAFTGQERGVLRTMLERGTNAPLTSSAGRLFDAVASILGLCQRASFEGEAAMAVEFASDRASAAFALPPPLVSEEEGVLRIDWRSMLGTLMEALQAGTDADDLAAGFHDWLVCAIVDVSRRIGIERVVLTGGCFQNARLTEQAEAQLRAAGFQPFRHLRVPTGDGGLAVGQAAFAARMLTEEKR
ncbi:carbamoyltransferase HypF [Novosphingobium mangrovi (ex Huang et al. 2023)]|uniref:Carbamoyltransferase HypF n=1 Tax=Novosphingobium mangrovi (ex Huang et al. 2023) TaxID=2976432 RepID=A0ABT2I0L0_9SPHN|nr:carbamoyltransferase HypF [Novosphingobium mangrovi (ex Huang et al. 2023)]MCT2398336.1 carbamoyltransferase HypF [Novosphingobium mangrovi (ex Huang et al. 2023)]